MSDQTEKRIVVQEKRGESLAWDSIKSDKDAVINRIRAMIVNGKKLNDSEVFALTSYSLANDLNPFNGEAYFIPGAGPAPGVSGYRKKSKLALKVEAKEAGVRAPYYTESYRKITDPEEVGHNPEAGDIAYECSIADNVSLQGHADIMTDAMSKLMAAGVEADAAYKAALKIAGNPPCWTGIGIVWANENFGNKEMFSRHERAMKRASKVAIKKRWPSLDIPSDPEAFDHEEPQIEISMPEKEEQEQRSRKTNDEIMAELGFETDETDDAEDAEYEDIIEEVDPLAGLEPPKTAGQLYKMATQGKIPHIGVKAARDAVDQANGEVDIAWEIVKDLSAGLAQEDQQELF